MWLAHRIWLILLEKKRKHTGYTFQAHSRTIAIYQPIINEY